MIVSKHDHFTQAVTVHDGIIKIIMTVIQSFPDDV